MEYRFYAIGISPDNYRYIGATRQKEGIKERFTQHKLQARRSLTKMPIHDWLRKHMDEAQLFDLGSGPIEQEAALIAMYRSLGHDLLNVAEGGIGAPGFRHTAEERALRSVRGKGNHNALGAVRSDEYREMKRQERLGVTCEDGCTCGRHSPEVDRGAKISAAKKGKQHRGMHTRWHVNRGIVSPECRFCTTVPGGQMSSQTFEMTFTAEAEVLRGCCGKSHEFGSCPCSNSESSEEN